MASSGPLSTRLDELASRLRDPGFTPSVRGLEELLDAHSADDEKLVSAATRAVLRIDAQHAATVSRACAARAKDASRPARGNLTLLAGRLVREKRDPDALALGWLYEALTDGDPKTRRAAARSLGNLPRSKDIEAALAKAYDDSENADDRRALAMALGKIGGEAAIARLAAHANEPKLGKASIIAARETARSTSGSIETSSTSKSPVRIWLHTRSGLEGVVMGEISGALSEARLAAPGTVEAMLRGPLATALELRTVMHVGFPLRPTKRSTDLAEDIARGMSSRESLSLFRTFTSTPDGAPIRFRLAFAKGGHRRAIAWRVAELVRGYASELLNDPTESTWEVVVDERGPELFLELVPRGYDDTRFSYRGSVVPASSHPVVAAALARLMPRRDDDVVWDPFVGAGAELVERARLGPFARLIGTDIDTDAVNAARANLARASIASAEVTLSDALSFDPRGVTAIVTNPPMGRRVQRGTHADLLERFVAHAARVLVPGGALVWLAPDPERLRTAARAARLKLSNAFTIDMGGFPAELCVWLKP
jgi:23S rRNA G2445 N2-methylase RlmL